MNRVKYIFIFGMSLLSCCSIQIKVDASKDTDRGKSNVKVILEEIKEQTYTGWWIYGEEQHIFKDKKTLNEYDLEFPNENMAKLKELYLEICEMEYFPMECVITGTLKKTLLHETNTIVVANFEVLYIEGCGE